MKKRVLILSFVLFFSQVNLLFAQIGSSSVGVEVESTEWFTNLFLWLIGLAGLVAAAVLIFNAYLYITAGGDEGKIQKAAKGITYAIVGLVIAAIAFLIVNFVIERIDSASGEMSYCTKEKNLVYFVI